MPRTPVKTPTPPPVRPGKPVGAAVNTVQLLRYAVAHDEAFTATEAARATGLNPSTCFNLVQTLVAEGLFEDVPEGRRYRVGAGLAALARQLNARGPDLEAVQPRLQAVADRFKVTATLWKRRSPTRMELLKVASCNTAVNIQMPVGQRLPLLVGGMGRILALQGGLSDEERLASFNEVKWHRPLTLPGLMAQARQARRLGWGVDDGYMHRSVTAVAVPVPPPVAGTAVDYTCSATMFRHQYSAVALQDIARGLQAVAAEVARLLGER